MALTEFTFKILITFFPGYVTYIFIRKLTSGSEHSIAQSILYSLMFGLLDYLIYPIFLHSFNALSGKNISFHFPKVINKGNEASVSLTEIGMVTLLGILIGVLVILIERNRLLHRLSRYVGLTGDVGGRSVWDYLMDQANPEEGKRWVLVSDKDRNLRYQGWIKNFSRSSNDTFELFLRDVRVYNIDGHLVEEQESNFYISGDWQDLLIEFPERF